MGDAAGRPGDHSDSDKGFAAAVGMRFYTPEAFFETPSDHPPNDVETNKNEAKKQNSGGGADAVIVLDDEDDADAFDRKTYREESLPLVGGGREAKRRSRSPPGSRVWRPGYTGYTVSY